MPEIKLATPASVPPTVAGWNILADEGVEANALPLVAGAPAELSPSTEETSLPQVLINLKENIEGTPGPANTLSIGTVTVVETPEETFATITGTAPEQTLNLGLPRGPAGTAGSSGKSPYNPSSSISIYDDFFQTTLPDTAENRTGGQAPRHENAVAWEIVGKTAGDIVEHADGALILGAFAGGGHNRSVCYEQDVPAGAFSAKVAIDGVNQINNVLGVHLVGASGKVIALFITPGSGGGSTPATANVYVKQDRNGSILTSINNINYFSSINMSASRIWLAVSRLSSGALVFKFGAGGYTRLLHEYYTYGAADAYEIGAIQKIGLNVCNMAGAAFRAFTMKAD